MAKHPTFICQSCGADSQAQPLADYMYAHACKTCGGDGARLPAEDVMCPECCWLRPLGVGYEMPVEAFLWRLDAEAMMRLRSLGPVTAAAHHISERYGRPWFEASDLLDNWEHVQRRYPMSEWRTKQSFIEKQQPS